MTAINPFIAYDNRFADATPVANNTAAGNYNAANLADMRPYTWWKPSGFIGYGQAVGVSVNCGAPKSADYAAIFGHDLFSNQCILAIDSSTDNFVANATNRATITPTDDNADLVQFTSASAQYWRIVLYRINQFNSLYQDDLGNAAYWAKTATVTPNTAVAPDGTTTSDTITDNSATVIQSVARTCDTYNVKKTYRASIDVLKDAVPAATRYCGLNIYFGGTSPENYAVVLDTSTGAILHKNLATAAMVSVANDTTHWRISVAAKSSTGLHTSVSASFYPAMGATSLATAQNVATTGSCGAWRFRLDIDDLPSIAIANIGVGLEMPTSCPFGVDTLNRKVYGQTNISEKGQPLGKAILFEGWSQTLSFQYLSASWIRNTFLPAWKAHLRGKPFLFAYDLTNQPNEVYLVEAGDTVKAPMNLPTYNTLSFDVSGIALP